MAILLRGTPMVSLTGDRQKALDLRGFAFNELAKLKNLMSFNSLKQDVRRVKLQDGSEIMCRSVFGQDFIDIYSPAVSEDTTQRVLIWTGASYKGMDVDGSWIDSMFYTDDGNPWSNLGAPIPTYGFQTYDRTMMQFYTKSAEYMRAEVDDGGRLPDLEDVSFLYIPNLYRELSDGEIAQLQAFTTRGGKLVMAGDWLQLSGTHYLEWDDTPSPAGMRMGTVPPFHEFTNNALAAVGSPLRARPDLAALQGDLYASFSTIAEGFIDSFFPNLFTAGSYKPLRILTGQLYRYAAVMFDPLKVSDVLSLGSFYPWMIWHAGAASPVFVSDPTDDYPIIEGNTNADAQYSAIFPTPRGNYMSGCNLIVEREGYPWPGRIWFLSRDYFTLWPETKYRPLTETTWVCHVPTNTMLLGFTTWSETRDYYMERARFLDETYPMDSDGNGWSSFLCSHCRRHDIHYVWDRIVRREWQPVEINLDPNVLAYSISVWGAYTARVQIAPGLPLSGTSPYPGGGFPVQG